MPIYTYFLQLCSTRSPQNRGYGKWPFPITLKRLRGFLGLTGFYHRFIKKYASIAYGHIELFKKDAFCWDDNAQQPFDLLKKAMTAPPVLSIPDFSKQFVLQTDSSITCMDAVLTQDGHPDIF